MFIPGSCQITFADQSLQLLPDRAVYWPARKTLLLADVHLGKTASFRSFGLPVPEGSTEKDLGRITQLFEQIRATRLLILGDLIHAKSGCHPEMVSAIARWRHSHAEVEMLLIRGNHDRSAGPTPREWNVREFEEPHEEDGFLFTHDAPCDPAIPTFAGHVHPTVHLTDFDGSIVTAPCFVFDDRCAILPAFGTFTGGHKISPEPSRRLFLIAPGRVVPLSTREGSRI